MRNIVYLNNYLDESVIQQRDNGNVFSQAANNKVLGIKESLELNECNVTILSSGLVNGKSAKWFKRSVKNNGKIIYCGIFDFPFLNTISSIITMYLEIAKLNKNGPIDNIIFYNYKPEVAWAAYIAKKTMGIPITIEYEDGYSQLDNIKGLKHSIFKFTEKYVSKYVSSAIVVNSLISKKYNVPSVVVRGVVNESIYNEACKTEKTNRDKQVTLAYTGGLDNQRGIDVLIGSLKYLKKDVKIIVTGKGTLNCNDPRLEYRGIVPYDELKKILLSSDILLQCQKSRNSFSQESFPSKLFEYIATRNLIISSDIEDVKEFAGDALLYYENDDPKRLAMTIEKAIGLLGNKERKAKIERLAKNNLPKEIGSKILQCIS